VTGPPPDYFAP